VQRHAIAGRTIQQFERIHGDLGAWRPSDPHGVCETAETWLHRELPGEMAIVSFGSLPVRIRTGQGAAPFGILFAMAIDEEGAKDVLGLWGRDGRACDDWRDPMRDLRARGLTSIRIVQGDFDQAFASAARDHYPDAIVQDCISALLTRTLLLAPPRQRSSLHASLRAILHAPDAASAAAGLAAFARGRQGQRYPDVVALWRSRWPGIATLFELPPALRPFLESFDAGSSLKAKFARRASQLPTHFREPSAAILAVGAELQNVVRGGWRVAPHLWAGPRRQLARQA